MRFILGVIFLALVIILLGVMAVALLLAIALGLGWVMTKFLPFSWFETSTLALIGTVFVTHSAIRLFRALATPPETGDAEDTSFISAESDIPVERFVSDEEGKTNEAWFRYEIANHIYEDLSKMDLDMTLGKPQQKELAIRLTDIGVYILKNRTPGKPSRRVNLTVAQMKTRMSKMGQQPYDDDILETAVAAINLRLSYDEDLIEIVLDKSWDEIDENW